MVQQRRHELLPGGALAVRLLHGLHAALQAARQVPAGVPRPVPVQQLRVRERGQHRLRAQPDAQLPLQSCARPAGFAMKSTCRHGPVPAIHSSLVVWATVIIDMPITHRIIEECQVTGTMSTERATFSPHIFTHTLSR